MTIDAAEFERRLAAHLDAARTHGGPAVTKGADYYGGRLDEDAMRRTVVSTCQAAGIRGQFDASAICSRRSLRLWKAN